MLVKAMLLNETAFAVCMALNLELPKKKVFLGPALIWKRIVAFILDLILIEFIIIGPFRLVIMKLAGFEGGSFGIIFSTPSNVSAIGTVFGLISIFGLAYFVLTEYVLGQTIGKMLMKLKVVSLSDKEQPGFGACVLRSLFLLPVTPFYFLWVLDPVFMMFNKNNQRLTEFLGKTMTIQEYTL